MNEGVQIQNANKSTGWHIVIGMVFQTIYPLVIAKENNACKKFFVIFKFQRNVAFGRHFELYLVDTFLRP